MEEEINAVSVGRLLDGCFIAKRITEALPPLPKGMKPRHNYVLHIVHLLEDRPCGCRVSDVSHRLGTTMPSVTRLVSELAEKGLLTKTSDARDGRAILLRLTARGEAYVKAYVLDFHSAWAKRLTGVTNAQIEQVIDILTRFSEAMPELPAIEPGDPKELETI